VTPCNNNNNKTLIYRPIVIACSCFHGYYNRSSDLLYYTTFKILTCKISNLWIFFCKCALNIALTRSIFSPKCTKYRLAAWREGGEGKRGWLVCTTPALQAPSWIKGSLHLRKVIRDGKTGGDARERISRLWPVGRGRDDWIWPPPSQQIWNRPWV